MGSCWISGRNHIPMFQCLLRRACGLDELQALVGNGGRTSPPPATCTVEKAKWMPSSSKACLMRAKALRITNYSPGLVVIFMRIWIAKSPNCSTPWIFSGLMM